METVIALIFIFVIPIALLFLWLKCRGRVKKLAIKIQTLELALAESEERQNETSSILSRANDTIEILNLKVETQKELLLKYQPVIDAETEADSIIKNARNKSEEILQTAENARISALCAAETSERQSAEIIANAEARANEIAGEAWEARNKLKDYEKQAQALKNIIEGYGERYIIPPQSVLDDLAENYSFAEAGEQLKIARAHTRAMIKAGEAATCEYVEDHRCRTAEAFVLDAFNGKVDTALADIRTENVGNLKQKIEDAFVLVNKNGQAFRNAKITEDYKKSRLSELKWAAAVMELREREREEQRAIKEKMREEEKARRDYERAMREAAKDEARLQEALAKARMEMEQASEEQKARYEQQLADLAEKLSEAEARSQRAQSMAQQTRSGYVYVISNIGSFGEDVFKIGMTRRLEPMDRIRELGDASVPFPFDVHAMIYCEDAPRIETALHKKFGEQRLNKVNPRKEFFRLGLAGIKDATKELGIEAQFTILAEAKEFRDSKAMGRLSKKELDKQMERLLSEEETED